MKYTLGLFLFSVGGWLLYTGYAQRRRVLEAFGGQLPSPGKTNVNSIETFGGIMRPILIGFLIYGGIKGTFMFFAFGGQEVLSLFDLAGFLFLLGSYGTWLTFKTKYRESMIPRAPAVVPDVVPAAVPALQVVEGAGEDGDELGRSDRDRDASGAGAGHGVRVVAGRPHAARATAVRGGEGRRRAARGGD